MSDHYDRLLAARRLGCYCAPYSKPCPECGSYGDGLEAGIDAMRVAALADGTAPTEPAPTGLEPGEIVAVPADLRVDPNGVQWEWWDQCFQNWHPCSIKWPLAERRTICRPVQNGDPR